MLILPIPTRGGRPSGPPLSFRESLFIWASVLVFFWLLLTTAYWVFENELSIFPRDVTFVEIVKEQIGMIRRMLGKVW